jgi:hypothetical protein
VFLAFDVFFAVFCVFMASFIGIALCCCLPCVVAILYALAGQVKLETQQKYFFLLFVAHSLLCFFLNM